MFRALVLACALFGSVSADAAQSILCVSKQHGLKIKADLHTDNGVDDAFVDMQVKMKRGYQGKLKRETVGPTASPGSVVMAGESSAGNFRFELIIPEKQLRKSFKNVQLSAYFEKPFTDHSLYPHRIPVRCNSRVK